MQHVPDYVKIHVTMFLQEICQHTTARPYQPVLSPLLTMTSPGLQDQLFVLVTGANR